MIFKDNLLKDQEWSRLLCRRLSRQYIRPAQVYRELLPELKHKNKTCNRGKQGQEITGQYRTTQACRDGIKRAKAGLELITGDDVKSNRKGFYRYTSRERKIKKKWVHC